MLVGAEHAPAGLLVVSASMALGRGTFPFPSSFGTLLSASFFLIYPWLSLCHQLSAPPRQGYLREDGVVREGTPPRPEYSPLQPGPGSGASPASSSCSPSLMKSTPTHLHK